jgi:hypothetical protein
VIYVIIFYLFLYRERIVGVHGNHLYHLVL